MSEFFAKIKGLKLLIFLCFIIDKIIFINTDTTCKPGFYITIMDVLLVQVGIILMKKI